MSTFRLFWAPDQEAARRGLRDAVRDGQDLGPAFEEVAGILAAASEDAFEAETSPEGQAWASLSQARTEQRARKGSWPGKILQDDGILASSMQTDWGALFAQIGSNMAYAATHQHGRGEIPERPFVGVSESDELAILDVIADHLGF